MRFAFARRVSMVGLVVMLLVPRGAAARGRKCTYTVKKGDTVSRIARKAGVSRANLIAANPKLKKNPDRLRVGQKLDLCKARRRAATKPKKCGEHGRVITHTVKKGETVGAIAAHYAVSKKSLRRYNRRLERRKNSMIRVGEKLRVCTELRRYTNRKWFTGGVQLPPGNGYNVRRPANAWGTPGTVRAIVASIARFRAGEPDAPPVQIGDISRENGGPLREHVSHQEGRDVDIGYLYDAPKDEDERKTMNLSRTWALVRAFADRDDVAAVFIAYRLQKRLYEHAQSLGEDQARLDALFEYPRGHDDDAVIHHWPGHTHHFHVRFKRDDRGRNAYIADDGTLRAAWRREG